MDNLQVVLICIALIALYIVGLSTSEQRKKMKGFTWITLDSCSIALGMAYCLDNGFWNILLDTLLGGIYIAYKITQIVIKFVGPI